MYNKYQITQDSPSGEYWIQTNNTNSPVQVYCDMNRTCCSTTGGWTRVANLDMTDPSQQCPDGFRLVNRTTCGRTEPAGCVSTTFLVHGIEYSHFCGRVIGYQDKLPEALKPWTILMIDGISLTVTTATHLDICCSSGGSTFQSLGMSLYSTRPHLHRSCTSLHWPRLFL